MTNPSRSLSNGRLAVCGSSLRSRSAFMLAKLATASGVTAPSAPPVQLIPIVHEARVGHRLLRCADRELREQVVAADFFLVQELCRFETLDLAGELHGALGRVEARDRARARSAGDEALPGALDARPQRGHDPQTRDRYPTSHSAISPSSRAGTAAPAPPCAASRPPRRGCRRRLPSRRP